MPGAIIGIVGSDASGKTTQAGLLVDALRKNGHRAVYVRPVFLLIDIMAPGRLKGRSIISPRRIRANGDNSDGKKLLCLLISPIGLVYSYLTYLCLRLYSLTGVNIVCDRYFFQLFYDLLGKSGIRASQYFPRPDLLFYLDAEVDTIASRLTGADKSVGRDYYREVIGYFRLLCEKIPFVRIDASLGKEAVSLSIADTVRNIKNIRKMKNTRNKEQLKFLLSLADPGYKYDKNSLGDIPWRNIAGLAKRNGLYTCLLKKTGSMGITSAGIENDNRRCLKDMERFANTINILNVTCRRLGIRYALIKSCESIPHIPRDVDIFMEEDAVKPLVEMLQKQGMRLRAEVYETAIKLDGEYYKIDIYVAINYFSKNWIANEFIWGHTADKRLFDVAYPGLDDEAGFLVVLIHSLFGHRRITLLDFLHLCNLNKRMNVNAVRKHASDMKWLNGFDAVIQKLDQIKDMIYNSKDMVSFPYLYERDLILGILRDSGIKRNIFIDLSLIMDSFVHRIEDTRLVQALRRVRPARNLANRLLAAPRVKRGDEKR